MQIYYQLKIFRNYLAYSSVNLTYINIIGLGFKRKRGAEGGQKEEGESGMSLRNKHFPSIY